MNDVLEQLANDPWFRWQHAFLVEWCSLAEGNADPHEVLDLAGEVYSRNPSRDPGEVAREAWDEKARSTNREPTRIRSGTFPSRPNAVAHAVLAGLRPR
jgi:hypothetical protein